MELFLGGFLAALLIVNIVLHFVDMAFDKEKEK